MTDRCVDYCSFGDIDGFAVSGLARSCLILCLLIHRKFTFGWLDWNRNEEGVFLNYNLLPE